MIHRGTILVVDDNLATLKMMVEILQSEGYQVLPADSGELALTAMASQLPDLVLLDIRMPGIDGFEVCRRLKRDERMRNTPVIFLSAEADQQERVDVFSLGAVDFVSKPFQREELLARINTHLELWYLRQHLEEEVAQRTRALELLNQELHDKNAELDRFAYTVSHDLKSPLITIQSYAGMIVKDMDSGKYERAREDIKRIEGAADKMTALLNDLLELSRAGRQMNESTEVDMNRLVNNVLAQLAGPLKQSQVEVVLQPDLPAVPGDPKRIAEVVQNLIENAIKYRGEQPAPRIEIGVRNDGKERIFFVSDNGKGIDPCHHEKVFGLFNQLEANSQGTGVGLALVKRIIEVHGGRVWVESEGEGKGSRFCFTVGKA